MFVFVFRLFLTGGRGAGLRRVHSDGRAADISPKCALEALKVHSEAQAARWSRYHRLRDTHPHGGCSWSGHCAVGWSVCCWCVARSLGRLVVQLHGRSLEPTLCDVPTAVIATAVAVAAPV